jgi:hypothetical protein
MFEPLNRTIVVNGSDVRVGDAVSVTRPHAPLRRVR